MIEAMPRPRPPFLRRETTRHGRTVWYFRQGNKRVRLPDQFGSDEFWQAYNDALAGRAQRKRTGPESGTLAWLIARYRESAHYIGLKASTRYVRDGIMHGVAKESGHVAFVKITRKHIREALERRSATPHAANNFLIAMNAVFRWALDHEHVTVNPCEGVRPLAAKIEGHHTWTEDEVERYRQHHPIGTTARLALDLLLFTGLRRSDVFRVGRQHIKDGVLSIRMEKTGKSVHIPIFTELQRSIEATETGDLALLATERGTPFASASSFGGWFRKACDEAGLKHCSAHGLRKAGATMAANAGATPHELMAMYGWSKLSMAEIYTRDADRKRLARGAAERIANRMTPHQK